MNATALTYGNLALSYEPEETRLKFEVIDGGITLTGAPVLTSAPARHRRSSWSVSLALSASMAIALAVVFLGSFLFLEISSQKAYDAALSSAQREQISVQANDTLWSIAEAHPISGLSTSDAVNVISEWNHLDGGCLHPGDTLLVPAAVHSN